ncbi:hypothetical protein D1872_219710 [compost metagenome]
MRQIHSLSVHRFPRFFHGNLAWIRQMFQNKFGGLLGKLLDLSTVRRHVRHSVHRRAKPYVYRLLGAFDLDRHAFLVHRKMERQFFILVTNGTFH